MPTRGRLNGIDAPSRRILLRLRRHPFRDPAEILGVLAATSLGECPHPTPRHPRRAMQSALRPAQVPALAIHEWLGPTAGRICQWLPLSSLSLSLQALSERSQTSGG